MQAFAEVNPGFVHFFDLGSGFLGDELASGKKEVVEALMPDSLHPSSGARSCPRMPSPCVYVALDLYIQPMQCSIIFLGQRRSCLGFQWEFRCDSCCQCLCLHRVCTVWYLALVSFLVLQCGLTSRAECLGVGRFPEQTADMHHRLITSCQCQNQHQYLHHQDSHSGAVGMRILATRLEPIICRLVSVPVGASLDNVANI